MSTLDICDRVMVIVDGRSSPSTRRALLQREQRLLPLTPPSSPPGARRGPAAVSHERAAHARPAGGTAGDGGARAAAESPDFFIVGHPKSGTTALYEMLQPAPADLHARRQGAVVLRRGAARAHAAAPGRHAARRSTSTSSLFAGAQPEQRVGEATALYLWSRTRRARIAEVQPDARIIAILREPASFLRSLHLQFVQTYVETESDLRKALALEDARREGREIPRYTYWPQALLYSEHVRYVEQLQPLPRGVSAPSRCWF